MMLPVPSGPEIGALLALRMVIKRQQRPDFGSRWDRQHHSNRLLQRICNGDVGLRASPI